MSLTLTLLGTGHPGCYPNVFQSSAAVVVDGIPIIVDCGGGTVQRISSACAAGQPALRLGNLKTLIITHMHPDHTAGLADFIGARSSLDATLMSSRSLTHNHQMPKTRKRAQEAKKSRKRP